MQVRIVAPCHCERRRFEAIPLAAAENARLAPAASSPSLAALFADSPLACLDDFEDGLMRERSPVREAPDVEA